MCAEQLIRRVAGTVILLSLVLAWGVSHAWLFATAFVGFNLLQSSFTDFCPLERILARFGVTGCAQRCGSAG